MASRCQFENNNEVGVFAKLTNAYCLTALGGSENFYRQAASRYSNSFAVLIFAKWQYVCGFTSFMRG